jgi:hypothetical protein
MKTNEIKLRSGATSLFDVRCSMFSLFDVRRSSFKTTLYGTNVTCECLQNKLELMGVQAYETQAGIREAAGDK